MDKKIKEDVKDLVIARFETSNSESKLMLLGEEKPLSVKELIKNVKKDTLLGEKIMEVQYTYLKRLTKGEHVYHGHLSDI